MTTSVVQWFDKSFWIGTQIRITLDSINQHHYFFPLIRISVGNYPTDFKETQF